jgi:hypothetical protein
MLIDGISSISWLAAQDLPAPPSALFIDAHVITRRRRLSRGEYELRPLNQQRRISSTGQPQDPDP